MSLREAFIEELKDIYDAEKQILKALPKMMKVAEHEDLKSAFEMHMDETEDQVERLEKVFKIFGQSVRGKKCKGMEGLIGEGKDLMKEQEGDAALICAAQKIEHYEIASYGSLAAWAELMGEDDAVRLLEQTLREEEQTDKKLTDVAESAVNVEEAEEATAGMRGRR